MTKATHKWRRNIDESLTSENRCDRRRIDWELDLPLFNSITWCRCCCCCCCAASLCALSRQLKATTIACCFCSALRERVEAPTQGQMWDRVPSSIVVCEGVGGRITTVNKLFRQRVFNYPAIAHVHFMELVRVADAKRVKTTLARALLDGQLHTVSFGLLILDCTNQFPKHIPCDAQITADSDGEQLVISICTRPHRGKDINCAGATALDFVSTAPIPLHWIGKCSQLCKILIFIHVTAVVTCTDSKVDC
jgi:hypothetical protein